MANLRLSFLLVFFLLSSSCGVFVEGPWSTWTDSGLTWQVSPADDVMTWHEAENYCDNLALDGHSDWRLPSISELRTLILDCPNTETCGVTDGCLLDTCRDPYCDGCPSGQGPTAGCYWPEEMEGSCSYYWSSSLRTDPGSYAWDVDFDRGSVGADPLDDIEVINASVRCVRLVE